MESYGRTSGEALELGSFAGGITFELADYPDLGLTIADETPAYLNHLRNELFSRHLSGRVRLLDMSLEKLILPDAGFDLVMLRGAFFFIMKRPNILREIYRVLRPGGLAFVGGGYGKYVPQEVIDEIADESRVLNDRLGRQRVTIDQIKRLLTAVGLDKKSRIVEEGGVWILIGK
jgi:ubiquinone/menaquinone biosynthesis C-methylase UbiE